MKLDVNKIELNNITEHIYQVIHDNTVLRFWSPKILTPFGVDNEYNKYIMKLELEGENNEHIHLKKIVLHIEKLIRSKLSIDDIEFKSILRERGSKNDLIECRIKSVKNIITTIVEFEDKENNYLKTIFDIPKQSYVKVQFEINGLWDYRTEKKEKNKSGLIVYLTKIIVLK